MIARLHAWLCRHNWHDYGMWIEIGGATTTRFIERCSYCGKEGQEA